MKHLLPKLVDLMHTSFYFSEDCDDLNSSPSCSSAPHFCRSEGQVWVHPPTTAPAMSTGWSKTAAISSEANWPEFVPLFKQNPYLLVEDEQGHPLGYLCQQDCLDAVFTSYQYLEAYFEAMIKTMDASITIIDNQLRVVVWTEGAEQIFSIKAEEIIGRRITDFFPADMLRSLKTLQTGESVYRQQHQPREDLFVLINSNPIMLQQEIIGSVVAETDITSQVRLNQELYKVTRRVHHLQQEVAKLSSTADPFRHIIGTSPEIRQLKELIKRISTTKATVLILGESGVGKELFAKAVHDASENPDAPFVAINCAAIAPTLFESELFGYEKGAFSGANQRGKKGMIELASGGTLFLDEIGEMPLEMQAKLLRVLQEKTYYSVGGTKEKEIDFRIVAATNKDLEQLINEGAFRPDLYYRLNVVTLHVPPLRVRRSDIIELTHYFLYEFSLRYNRPIPDISQHVMQALLLYDWPGNVRELRNVIERLIVFSTDRIVTVEDLPFPLQATTNAGNSTIIKEDSRSLQAELDQYERRLIQHALQLENGNKLATAKRLGISRATLYNKMNRLKIPFR